MISKPEYGPKKYTIKTLRKMRGWSQASLGQRVGVSQYTVSRWEQDPAYLMDAAYKYIVKLAQVLDVTIDQIDMTEDEGSK